MDELQNQMAQLMQQVGLLTQPFQQQQQSQQQLLTKGDYWSYERR